MLVVQFTRLCMHDASDARSREVRCILVELEKLVRGGSRCTNTQGVYSSSVGADSESKLEALASCHFGQCHNFTGIINNDNLTLGRSLQRELGKCPCFATRVKS
jgi:hypothetical protein